MQIIQQMVIGKPTCCALQFGGSWECPRGSALRDAHGDATHSRNNTRTLRKRWALSMERTSRAGMRESEEVGGGTLRHSRHLAGREREGRWRSPRLDVVGGTGQPCSTLLHAVSSYFASKGTHSPGSGSGAGRGGAATSTKRGTGSSSRAAPRHSTRRLQNPPLRGARGGSGRGGAAE